MDHPASLRILSPPVLANSIVHSSRSSSPLDEAPFSGAFIRYKDIDRYHLYRRHPDWTVLRDEVGPAEGGVDISLNPTRTFICLW